MLPEAAAHVFVADLAEPELAEDDRHHLERVLRLRAGEAVTVSDGFGGWRLCRYTGGGRLSPAGDVCLSPRPVPPVGVAFALIKGDRPEWMVQKLAEAGVDHIMPIVTERCVVHWVGEKGARHVARLRTVAIAAAKQSRQLWLPSVHDVQPLAVAAAAAAEAAAAAAPAPAASAPAPAASAAAAAASAAASAPAAAAPAASAVSAPSVAGGGVAMAHFGGGPPTLAAPTILVGPEGGWAPAELDLELPRVSLGPTVLRAETAAVAAGVLLCALRAGIVGPVR